MLQINDVVQAVNRGYEMARLQLSIAKRSRIMVTSVYSTEKQMLSTKLYAFITAISEVPLIITAK
jgi:hypothetical protein